MTTEPTTRAVVPVVGLLIIITATLVFGAITAVVAFDIDQPPDPAPQAALDERVEGDTVMLEHQGGDPIDPDSLTVNGGELDSPDEQVTAGETMEINASDDTVTVIYESQTRDSATILTTVDTSLQATEFPPGDLQTENGGLFVQFDDGSRSTQITEGDSFSDVFGNLDDIEDGSDGLVAWVVDDVDKVAESQVGSVSTELRFSEDDELDDTGHYARAATGFGTPQPWQGDYELTTIEATEDGISTEWTELE